MVFSRIYPQNRPHDFLKTHIYSAHFCIPDTFVAGVDTNPEVSNEDQQQHICNIVSDIETNVATGTVVIGADFNDINIPSGESIISFLEGTGTLNAGFCSETTLNMTDAVSTDVTHIMGTGGLDSFSNTGRGNPSFGEHGYVVASIELETSVDNLVGIHPYSVNNRGGVSLTSAGSAETLSVGYARIQPSVGATTPSGLAIFGFRQNGILISEAGVPAAPLVQEGRLFAEVNGPVNTGLAIANPGDGAATINFFFTDRDGMNFGSGTFELGAHQQTAKFLDQEPFSGGNSVLGTFTFSSSAPISVIALRGFTNEQSEFLMTTLPVAPLSSTSSDTIYFPHFADGGGWTTQVVLINPTDSTVTGTVGFLGSGSGTMAALPVDLILDDGSVGSNFAYSIPARSSRRITTSNPDGTTSVGSVRATGEGGSAMPSGLVIFSFVSGGVTVSEAGVPALPEGSAFRVYVETSGIPGHVGSVRSGIAITDTSGTLNTATLELTNVDGSLAVASQTLSIPPSGQVALFLDELFSLPDNFSGVLRVTSTSSVAMVGLRLRVNERSEIKTTTTPPCNEVSAATSVDTYFPHIVDSDGWSTQFILISGTAGQISSGTLSFVDQTGQPIDLDLQE